MTLPSHARALGLGALVALSSGCSCADDEVIPDRPDAATDSDASDLSRPDTYSFPSRFASGESSVDYSGQVFRQTLIGALDRQIAGWTQRAQIDQEILTGPQWVAELDLFYRFDPATTLAQPIDLGLALPTLQTSWADISAGANLHSKTAGEDDVTDHQDWDAGAFVGWSEGAPASPVALVDLWFATLGQAAVDRAATIPDDPLGDPITEVYITTTGQDLRALTRTFLLGALTFSQGSDDYLDSGTADKGLESINTQDGENPHSVLEHTWDEGFGYFGATRDHNQHSLDDNADVGFADTSGDGMIDLQSELSTGLAQEAARRDRDSTTGARTNFSGAAFEAFIDGRTIIWRAAGQPLSAADKTELETARDTIIESWEAVFAATVIHQINATIAHMDAINGAGTHSFVDHARAWGELKGLALAFQFNPRSRVSETDFAMIHTLLGDAPVITDAQGALDAYEVQLLAARDLLEAAFGFDSSNVESW